MLFWYIQSTKTKKNSIDCIGTVDSTNGHAGSSTGI